MLKLVVSAPNKQKVELDCEPSTTFGDVKAKIEQALGVPADKQRLLCNGKERKDAKETLAAAGVTAKSKLMLMLAQGYTMPAAAPPEATESPAAPAASEEVSAVAPPFVEREGDLPPPADGAAIAEHAVPGMVHVRQGRNRYHVRVPQGLAAATFGELADYLSAAFLLGVPSAELRFLSRGKTPERTNALGSPVASEISVMLLFREGFHVNADSAQWLRESQLELEEAEKELGKLRKRIEANFSNEETALKLAEVGGVLATLRQSVDSVRVFESSLTEMRSFRERVVAAHEEAESLRKAMRL